MMTYEDLTKRIKKAREAKEKTYALSQENSWWEGYISALRDLRNDCNTGGEKQCKKH